MYVTFRGCMSRSRKGSRKRRMKESTWSTCCEFLSELVSFLQLVKPPLIYVLRGHYKVNEKNIEEGATVSVFCDKGIYEASC